MKANADPMSGTVIQKIRASERCAGLTLNISAEEQKHTIAEVYRDLVDWLATETSSSIRERYIAMGVRRAQQGVPFTDLYWAVCIAHEYLWEYMQQECLLDEPVEFWGGVNLLRSLTQFFDNAFYFILLGYQKAGKNELAGAA
ncbi:MAG TPA: hypothetical protein VJA94_15940 [Candidatus Angelobacter sp.]|jgi:hypothetical protein